MVSTCINDNVYNTTLAQMCRGLPRCVRIRASRLFLSDQIHCFYRAGKNKIIIIKKYKSNVRFKDHLGWISSDLYLCKYVQLDTITTWLIRAMFPVYIDLFLNIQAHTDNNISIISILSYMRVFVFARAHKPRVIIHVCCVGILR